MHNEMTKFAGIAALAWVAAAARAALPTSGTYAVLTTRDYNADSLYANTLSGDAKTAVTTDADYGKGFFASSLTSSSKVNRWTLYTDGTASSESPTAAVFPPNASYDYWVGNNVIQIATPNGGDSSTGTYAFSGRSLTLSGGTIAHCSKGTTVVDLGSDVRVIGTSTSTYSFPARSTADPQTRGTITVADGATFYVSVGVAKTDASYGLGWEVSGGETAQIKLACNRACAGFWRWRGASPDFLGTLTVATPTTDGYTNSAAFYAPFGGTVDVKASAQIRAGASYATAPVAALVLETGARAVLTADAALAAGSVTLQTGSLIDTRATDALPLTAQTSFVASGLVRVLIPSSCTNRTVLTVPASVDVDSADFAFVTSEDGENEPYAHGCWRANGDGTKSLVVEDATPVSSVGTTYTVTDRATLTNADERVRVTVASGATLALALDGTQTARMGVKGEAGSTIELGRIDADWSALPALWLDASAANTLSNIVVVYDDSCVNYDHTPYLEKGQTVCDPDGNPYVLGWYDCRASQQSVKAWNHRYDLIYGTTHNVMFGTHPRRILDGLNGYDVLAFDRPSKSAVVTYANQTEPTTVAANAKNLSRIYFRAYADAPSSQTRQTLSPRYAFFVYGSQEGGGGALLGGNARFIRAGTVGAHTKDDAIFASDAPPARVWLDGTEVDPKSTGFNGSWQVVTVDFIAATNSFTGLGFGANDASDNGGQRYAEVILVTEELTERQRRLIEIHLAEKWGLASSYAYPDWAQPPVATVYGAGTVKLVQDARLSGAFAGTIDLNGRTLTVDGTALPPGEEAVDPTDLSGWYDPDHDGSLARVTSGSAHPKSPSERANWLYDRRTGSTATDGFYALTGNGTDRAPWVDASAHGFGPVRHWIDYSNVESNDWQGAALNNGNTLRFRVASGGTWSGNVVTNAFRTIVMAQDSKYGGGQPFVDGNSVLPSANATLYKIRNGQTADSPIYPSGTAALLTEGVTRLDGEVVDGTASGFHGRPEILTVQPTASYGPVCFEHLNNNQNVYGSETRAAVQGEILMWRRTLETDELARVEAYLAWKWLGIVSSGYAALTNATVTGSGRVTAQSVALLPKFASDFSGTVSVPLTEGLDFTLVTAGGATSVEGARDFGGGALETTGAVTVRVARRGTTPKVGLYRLLGWGTPPADATWSLALDGWTRASCALRVAADGLYLDLRPVGLGIIFR